MNSKDYSLEASRTFRNDNSVGERLAANQSLMNINHAVLGISGEAGELTDSVKKSVMYGKPLEVTNLKEECGDVLWYMALLLHTIDSSFDEVMQLNADKLRKRYPTGYSDADAIERKDKHE